MAKILTLADAEIGQRTAELVAGALRTAIAAKGQASLAIAGGSATAPMAAVRELMAADWGKVRLTWVDERCVDQHDADSNRGGVYRQGGLSAEQAPGLELPLWLDGETSDAAITRVTAALASDFGGALDVALLGMGPDGHIASLFPGHPVLLDSTAATVAHIEDSPKPPPRRMTLTLPFLKKTEHCILLAMGEAKREPLQRIIGGDLDLPASALTNLTIVTNINLSEHKATS